MTKSAKAAAAAITDSKKEEEEHHLDSSSSLSAPLPTSSFSSESEGSSSSASFGTASHNIIKSYYQTQPWLVLNRQCQLFLPPVKSINELPVWYKIHFTSFISSLDKYNQSLLQLPSSIDTLANDIMAEILLTIDQQRIITSNKSNVKAIQLSVENRRRTIHKQLRNEDVATDASDENAFNSIHSSLRFVLLQPIQSLLQQRANALYVCLLSAFQSLPLNSKVALATDVRSIASKVSPSEPAKLLFNVCKAAFIPHDDLTSSHVNSNYPIEEVRIEIATKVKDAFSSETYEKNCSLSKYASRLMWYIHAFNQTGQTLTESQVRHHFLQQEHIKNDEQYMRAWTRVRADSDQRQLSFISMQQSFNLFAENLFESDSEDEGKQKKIEKKLQKAKERLEKRQDNQSFLDLIDNMELLLRAQGWMPAEESIHPISQSSAATVINNAFYRVEQPYRPRFQQKQRTFHCNECGKPGHISTECFRLLTCEHCGRKGHSAERCYHNPKSKEYKQEYRSFRDKHSSSDSSSESDSDTDPDWRRRSRDRETREHEKKETEKTKGKREDKRDKKDKKDKKEKKEKTRETANALTNEDVIPVYDDPGHPNYCVRHNGDLLREQSNTLVPILPSSPSQLQSYPSSHELLKRITSLKAEIKSLEAILSASSPVSPTATPALRSSIKRSNSFSSSSTVSSSSAKAVQQSTHSSLPSVSSVRINKNPTVYPVYYTLDDVDTENRAIAKFRQQVAAKRGSSNTAP